LYVCAWSSLGGCDGCVAEKGTGGGCWGSIAGVSVLRLRSDVHQRGGQAWQTCSVDEAQSML
jgi:hypothetical protein